MHKKMLRKKAWDWGENNKRRILNQQGTWTNKTQRKQISLNQVFDKIQHFLIRFKDNLKF